MQDKTTILSPLIICNGPMRTSASTEMQSGPQPDLLYMKSVLVSTGQNDNDDVFLPEEMWKARATPILKPVNWEHNSGYEIVNSENERIKNVVADNQIIGVMFKSYPALKDGTLIDDSQAQDSNFKIPSDFNIITEAAIYKYIFPKVTSKILNESAANKLYVSMEAWYTSFDYRVGNKVVARNEDTAFLDDYLRANGGHGVFNQEKVGRVLRNIVFGGVGIVANPANKDSVIHEFTNADYKDAGIKDSALSSHIISNLTNHSITVSKEAKIIMSDTQKTSEQDGVTEAQLKDYKDVVRLLAEQREDNKTQATKLAAAISEIESLKVGNENLSASVVSGMELVADALGDNGKQKLTASTEPFKTLSEIIAESNESSMSVTAKLAEAQLKLEGLELASKLSSRAQQIRDELSLDTDSQGRVDALVASTTTLDDDSFGSWLLNTKELFSFAKKGFVPFTKKDDEDKSEDDESKDKKDKKGKASTENDGETDTAVFDTAQASSTVISGGATDAGTPVTLEEKMSALASVLLGNSQKTKEA